MISFFSKRKRAIARRQRDVTALGRTLVDLGYCTPEQIKMTLADQVTIPLGQLLIGKGWLTEDQLEHALLRQEVLRGQVEPRILGRYGPDPRHATVEQIIARMQKLADSVAAIARKAEDRGRVALGGRG